MTVLHIMIVGKYDNGVCIKLDRNSASVTRGNSVKLQQRNVRYDLRKYFFLTESWSWEYVIVYLTQ